MLTYLCREFECVFKLRCRDFYLPFCVLGALRILTSKGELTPPPLYICRDASPDALVEEALFKACVGYCADVVKNYKVKKVEYDQQTGKKISEHEEIVQARDSVHIPPSIMAQRFYLTSRMPEKWGGKALPDELCEEAGVIVLPEIAEEGEDG